jgi:hypothetical protein
MALVLVLALGKVQNRAKFSKNEGVGEGEDTKNAVNNLSTESHTFLTWAAPQSLV